MQKLVNVWLQEVKQLYMEIIINKSSHDKLRENTKKLKNNTL